MKKTLAVALPILAVLLFTSVSRIPDGSVGIAERNGTIEVLPPGLHFHRPLASPGAVYALDLPSVGDDLKVTLKDGSVFTVGFDLSGKLDPARAADFHRSAREKGVDSTLRSAGSAALASAASGRPPVDLASGALGAEAARRAKALLAAAGVSEVEFKLRPLAGAEFLRLAQALAPTRLAGLLKASVSKLLESDKAGWEAHAAMGLVLETEKDLHGAEKEYLDALTINPLALPPMAQLVMIYGAVGENRKLDRLLDAALKAQPASLQHLGWLAMSFMAQNRLSEAQTILERALVIEPANGLLLNNLGGLMVRQGRLQEATATFHKALDAKPGDRQSLYNLGVALSAEGEDKEALTYLFQAEQQGAAGPPILLAIAHSLRKTGDAKRAAEYERRAHASAPGPAPAS